ncbi:MAG: GntR family transcriptional regulator [Actinomycetota bacterium]|nr:GntR family transcriptional regulator [Actinomycetota bacterium]
MNVSRSGREVQIRVPKTAELVARHLRKQIVRGELTEGDALPSETALMETFSISRPTLREAFRILESEGLIVVRRGAHGGARVQVPSSEVAAGYTGLVLQHRGATLADVFAARVIVEAPAAAMLARMPDRAARAQRLTDWLADFEGSTDHADYTARFHGFNRLLVELTENETLMLLTSMLETISDAASSNYPVVTADIEARMIKRASKARHSLIEHIAGGEADEAEELFRRHLAEAGSLLQAAQGGRVIDVLS